MEDDLKEEPFPTEASQMESVFSTDNVTADGTTADASAAATEAAAAIAANTDADTTAGATAGFSEVNLEADAEGPHSAHALAAARAHLAAVAEELATLQEHFGTVQCASEEDGSADLDDYVAKLNSREGDPNTLQLERIVRLERTVRHLQVDFDCAKSRAERLAYEKEELLAAQARLEADLRVARHTLEETKRRLQHREMDLQHLTGRQVETMLEADLPASPSQAGESTAANAAANGGLTSPVLRSVAESARPMMSLSRPQAIAALKAAQGELRDERKRRERLERRITKDKERLERLMSVAERQRDEIRSLQKRCSTSEAATQECMNRLHESLAHTSALQAALHGSPSAPPDHFANDTCAEVSAIQSANSPTVAASKKPSTPPFGGRAGSGASSPSMSRQQSAPTRLPSVAPPKRG